MISEKIENEKYWMVGSALAALANSIKINVKLQVYVLISSLLLKKQMDIVSEKLMFVALYQESKEVIRNIIVSEWCETMEIEEMITLMNELAKAWPKNDKSEQVLQSHFLLKSYM